jgi:hypothetical protein
MRMIEQGKKGPLITLIAPNGDTAYAHRAEYNPH